MSKNPQNYYYDDGVLLQLILHEFIEIFQTLKPALKNVKEQTKKNKPNIPKLLNDLRPALLKIGGQGLHPLFFIPWTNSLGLLEKLEDLTTLLVLHNEGNNSAYFTLHHEIHVARILAKECLQILYAWECQTDLFCETIDFKRTASVLEELSDQLEKTAHSLSLALIFSVKNENVVLCFLKKSRELASLFGKQFVKSTAKRMFPQGFQKAAHALSESFKRRGRDLLAVEVVSLLKTVK